MAMKALLYQGRRHCDNSDRGASKQLVPGVPYTALFTVRVGRATSEDSSRPLIRSLWA